MDILRRLFTKEPTRKLTENKPPDSNSILSLNPIPIQNKRQKKGTPALSFQSVPSTKSASVSINPFVFLPKKTKAIKTRAKKSKKSTLKNSKTIHAITNICSDSNYCVSFGLDKIKMNQYFNNFQNFNNADINYMRKIGDESKNGFIYEIPFEKNGQTVHVVLKSSAEKKSDNLLYEGYVGFFLNDYTFKFPCFLETYSIGKYLNETLYKKLKNRHRVSKLLMNTIQMFKPKAKYSLTEIEESCVEPLSMCVMTECLSNIQSMKTIYFDNLNIENNENFFNTTIIHYLYQIYSCLDTMKNIFTHYDLHTKNVQVYFPSADRSKYVLMRYHYSDGSTVEFATEGIVKIIDYGRSFFYKNATNNSKTLYGTICKISSCDPDCGSEVGFGWLNNNNTIYIDSAVKNISHDLRLLDILKHEKQPIGTEIESLFQKLTYGTSKQTKTDKGFGTPERLESGYPNHIYNVSDAHKCLKDILVSPDFQTKNQETTNKTKMGEMDVWLDGSRPIRYISYVDMRLSMSPEF
jgi:hypothetical protein